MLPVRKVLVAGATGYLGRHLVRALKQRGIWVRALTRRTGISGLAADDIFQGDVTQLSSLDGAASGMDAVMSCIGITRQREGFTYEDIDYQGNVNLLQIAEAEKANGFLYVALYRGQQLKDLRIASAKERFVARLRASALYTVVIRPTAFFSDMKEVLSLARKGRVFVFGTGDARINPISGRDLADASIEAFLRGQSELEIGGPRVFTHEEIAKLAFESLGRRANVWHVPIWVARAGSRILRALTPVQIYGPVEFFLTVATQDMVAPLHGKDQLSDFFRSPECR